RAVVPNQTPQKKFDVEGKIYVATSPRRQPAEPESPRLPVEEAPVDTRTGPHIEPIRAARARLRVKARAGIGTACAALFLIIAYLGLAASMHLVPFAKAGPPASPTTDPSATTRSTAHSPPVNAGPGTPTSAASSGTPTDTVSPGAPKLAATY